ncbi:diguanylate cyclase [Oceanithermus profundus DSM 14977]|uniref:Diguanylate cyclase n=1 Tax=Oceanithermus profundus (strain DSM 14977 / NBRC 100410 / VKM B-2274 / 506) TaxID=670487 RepID=E4U9U1_OCEP5|nr:diguanylate cyclase [Oceanithermus profundus DSM 14977]
MLIGAVAVLWLVVRAFRMPKLGPLAGTALALWGTAWALYFASLLGLLSRSPNLNVLLWLLLFAGYLPFVLLLRRLAQGARLPPGLYAFALFPIGFTFAAIQHVHPATHLYVLLLLQLLLLYYGLPAWYAVPRGRAPEARLLWLPTLVFVQIGITSWATLPPLASSEGMQWGFLIWTASLWLIVEGLRLEAGARRIEPVHLIVAVTVFMAMWALVVLNWMGAEAPQLTARYIVALSSLAAWGGILSVILPLHLAKTRSESKLTQWSSILGDLALFPVTRQPPTPESLARELFELFRRACENVVGLRLSVFDDLIVGERTRYGRTLEDRGIQLGRVYLGGSRRCGPFFKLLVRMVGQRLGEVIRSLDWQIQAHTDPLTGLFNRRGFEVKLPYALERARRGQRAITLAMLDLDRFKRVNDRYGHAAGDVLLQAVAELLERNLREDDLAVRWGGEEFLVLLTDSDLQQAVQIFERVRARIAELRLTDIHERVTASVGLAGGRIPHDSAEVFRWILEADDALIRAKQEGRDRIVTAT